MYDKPLLGRQGLTARPVLDNLFLQFYGQGILNLQFLTTLQQGSGGGGVGSQVRTMLVCTRSLPR